MTIYRDRRKHRGMSLETAALHVPCHRETLGKVEAGHPTTPDIALRLADIYSAPELTAHYCKNDCSVGQIYCYNIEKKSLEQATLELLYWNGEVQLHTHILKKITRDGIIEPGEMGEANDAILSLMSLEKAIEEYKLAMADVLNIPKLIQEINNEKRTAAGEQDSPLNVRGKTPVVNIITR